MAQNNGFNALFGITFEDYNSVKKKLDIITSKINSETAKGIKFNLDTDQITKTISDLSKLAKQNIQILPNGQITTLSKFNQELGKTITLKQNLTTGKETLSVDLNSDKIRKDTEKMYADLFKQQEDISAMQQKMAQQTRQQAEQEASEQNRILEEKYKAEQEFINASQKLKQKSYQESLKQAQAEASISNKFLEESYKEEENRKKELADSQKLIAYEKQKLQIRLQNIEANRKGLVNDSYSNKISDSISNLSGNTTSEVKDKVKQLNLELQKLDQNARMKGLQVGNKSIMSFGESIKSTATKLGIFVSTAMVLNEVQRTIRNATSYIIELDKSMIDLKKVTDETSETYDNFLAKMHNVALELGTQSNLMVDATTNWAKTGKNLQEASKLAENTILLTKVGDVDNVNTAQTYMLPALQAFNIEADKSIDLINEYNNISNNMATTVNDVGDAMSKSASSMSVAGNSLEQTIALIATAESSTKLGGAEIGTALKSLSMRLSTFKDEDGEVIPKLAEQIKDLTNVDLADINGQLKSTYQIYTEIGQIYNKLDKNSQLQLNEILGGKLRGNVVSAILTNVEELDRAYSLATNSAGSAMKEFETYQQGVGYAIDQLKEQINGLYSSFLNSGLFKGLINGASDAISSITSIINTLGTFPTVITTVVASMTIFNTKFRETIQMMLSFNPTLNKVFMNLNNSAKTFSLQGNLYKTQIEYLKNLTTQYQSVGLSTSGFGKKILDLNMKLALSTAKLVATKIAVIGLQLALSTLVSFGISFVVSKIGEFIDKLIVTQEELKQLNSDSLTTMKGNQDLISSVEELIKKEDELKSKLSSKGNTYEEQREYRTQLLDVQRQIADILPESASNFDEEGNRISANTEKVLENLDAKKKLAESEAIKAIENNSDYVARVEAPEEYEKIKKQFEDMQQAYKNNELYMDSEVTSKWLDKIEKKVQDYEETIKIMNTSIQSLRSAGWSEERIAQEIFKDMPLESAVGWYEKLSAVTDRYNLSLESVNKTQDEFNDTQSQTPNQSKSVEDLQDKYIKLGYSVADAKKKVEELNGLTVEDKNTQMLKDSTTAYSEAISKTKELEGLINSLNEEQSITPELLSQIISAYPEIGARISSVSETQEFLNSKISQSVDAQREAYNQMVGNDNTYYNSKVKNNDALQQDFNRLLSAFVTNSGKSYDADLNNYNNLNALKADLTAEYGSVVAQLVTDFVSSQSSGYNVDLDNTVSWASSKAKILRDLSNQITKVENQLANHLANIAKSATDSGALNDEKLYARAKQELANLNTQKEAIMTEFYKYSSGFKGYTPTFSGSDFAGSSGSGSSGSSATEKEVSNLEDLRDRYYEVNNALTQLNNKLDEYKTLMDKATDKDKISYLNQQLQILQKQETAYKNLRKEQEKELAELKSSLTSSGFSFSGDGTVANYQNRLNALTNYANSLSGDAKENAKSSVEAIAKNLERYTLLLLKEIPDVNKELLSLKNTTTEVNEEIKSIYKEKLDTVADVESQISELIKKNAEERIDAEKKALEKSIENDRKRIESKKKALQAEADLYNKQYSEDNYESELNEERNKLLQLQSEIDKLQFANDRKSQQRLSELLSQYESQQKLINDKIAEHQNQAINDRFEQEQELIDKELEAKENAYDSAIEELDKKLENFLSPQNLTNLVSSAMKSGFVDILGETVNLNDAMNDMFADTEVGIANLNIQYNDWLTNLNSIKDTIVDINKYMDGAGLNSRIDLSATRGVTPQALSIDMGGINIAGNVDRDVLEDINKMLKKQQEDILSIINKRLSGAR